MCILLILFLLFSPKYLLSGAKEQFVDTRFVRDQNLYRGTITLYHITRHRPYQGSLTNWLQKRADEYEKKHRGSSIVVEGMSEETFYERIEHGRRADPGSARCLIRPVSPGESLFGGSAGQREKADKELAPAAA